VQRYFGHALRRLVLATDLDGTLVGDGEALERLNRWILRHRDEVTVVYTTGRHFDSAVGLFERERLVRPDVLVCNVGAEIRLAPSYDVDPTWNARVREGWNPDRIRDHIRAAFPELVHHEIPTDLRLVFRTGSRLSEIRDAVAKSLENAGLPATVVVSTGGFIDGVPALAGKGRALHDLITLMGWPPDSVLVCGDSGNDLDMLLLGLSGVVVANATEEVLGVCLPDAVYKARNRCAAGIIEGLCHHGFIDERELEEISEAHGWSNGKIGEESAG